MPSCSRFRCSYWLTGWLWRGGRTSISRETSRNPSPWNSRTGLKQPDIVGGRTFPLEPAHDIRATERRKLVGALIQPRDLSAVDREWRSRHQTLLVVNTDEQLHRPVRDLHQVPGIAGAQLLGQRNQRGSVIDGIDFTQVATGQIEDIALEDVDAR